MPNNSRIAKIGFVSIFSFLILFGTALIPVAAMGASPRHDTNDIFVARLGPAPGVSTTARGFALFWMSSNGNLLYYVLVVQNIHNVFMAHIHFQDGSIILWLYPNPNSIGAKGQTSCLNILSGGNPSACPGLIRGAFSGDLASGALTAANLKTRDCAGCNGFSFAELISAMESGNAFVNVHTLQNPAGEIQGTITE